MNNWHERKNRIKLGQILRANHSKLKFTVQDPIFAIYNLANY